jgi:carbon-monoxide dehydrogenase small subunit/xanthine dehydrogenase small subunit
MIMAAMTLSEKPTLDEVKIALAGNLCRCTGYSAIYRAIMKWRGMPLPEEAGSAVTA